ncbi:hypothetical protein NEPAR07_1889, partial [Nematocida parisii]
MRYLTRDIITSNITEDIATAAAQISNLCVDIKQGWRFFIFFIPLIILFLICIIGFTYYCFFGWDEFKMCILCMICPERNISDEESDEEMSNLTYTITPTHIITVPPSSSLDQSATTPLSKNIGLPSYEEAV